MHVLRTIKLMTCHARSGDLGLWSVFAAVCLLLLLIVYVMLQPIEVFSSSGIHLGYLAADSQAPAERSPVVGVHLPKIAIALLASLTPRQNR